ncbi:MAG: hypothetical protein ACK5JT_17010 [Hyphomicrobiaceae bacterium]
MTSRVFWRGLPFATAVAFGLATPAALASVSLTNRDGTDHKVTIIEDEGKKTSDQTVKPDQVLGDICPAGCIIRLNDNQQDEYELEANDKVSIEEGLLYYDDGPSAPAGSTKPVTPPAEPKN